MTLDEAIQHCEEKSCGNSQCNQEHKQLADWLRKLQRYEKALKEISLYEGDFYGDEFAAIAKEALTD
jgi:hypothetical protein